jgi:biotin transporter BioY
MWRGLNSAKHSRAVVGTILRVLGPNWLAIFLLIFVRPTFRNSDVFVVFALWFVLGGIVDVIAGVVARENLRANFRRLVAHRFHP